MSFIFPFQSSQLCCLLEKGVCFLGESSLIPVSLFLEQTQRSEDQLLGDKNSGRGGWSLQGLRSQNLLGPPVAAVDQKPRVLWHKSWPPKATCALLFSVEGRGGLISEIRFYLFGLECSKTVGNQWPLFKQWEISHKTLGCCRLKKKKKIKTRNHIPLQSRSTGAMPLHAGRWGSVIGHSPCHS